MHVCWQTLVPSSWLVMLNRDALNIQFRECDWTNLWLWFEFVDHPVEKERQYLEQILDSWYSLGVLGGFNATSLAVQDAGADISYLEYDTAPDILPALMHNMGSVEYQGAWARCWVDLGTADALAIDVLLNALVTLSVEFIDLKRVLVGGINEDWPIEGDEDASLN